MNNTNTKNGSRSLSKLNTSLSSQKNSSSAKGVISSKITKTKTSTSPDVKKTFAPILNQLLTLMRQNQVDDVVFGDQDVLLIQDNNIISLEKDLLLTSKQSLANTKTAEKKNKSQNSRSKYRASSQDSETIPTPSTQSSGFSPAFGPAATKLSQGGEQGIKDEEIVSLTYEASSPSSSISVVSSGFDSDPSVKEESNPKSKAASKVACFSFELRKGDESQLTVEYLISRLITAKSAKLDLSENILMTVQPSDEFNETLFPIHLITPHLLGTNAMDVTEFGQFVKTMTKNYRRPIPQVSYPWKFRNWREEATFLLTGIMDLRHNSTPTQPASQGLAQHGLYNAGGYNYLNYRLGLLLKRHRDQSRLPNFAYACLKRLGYTKFDQIRYARRLTYLLYGLPVEYGLAPAILTSWISKPSNQQFLQMRQIIIWDINNHNQEKLAANN